MNQQIFDFNYPSVLVPTSTWGIADSTKLNAAQSCQRRYFYEFVLGWRPDRTDIHLKFGQAFHLGMEHLIENHGTMRDNKTLAEAFEKFYHCYREEFSFEDDAKNSPKDPLGADKAFRDYALVYGDEPYKVLYTEVAGSAPLDAQRAIHFKLDAVCEDSDGIYCLEHKTASQDSAAWAAQWRLAIQPATYVHVLYCLYDKAKVFGCKINGVLFRKSDMTAKDPFARFKRVPIRKSVTQMQVWQWNVLNLIKSLEFSYKELSKATPDDSIMQAFPMNTKSCTDYNRPCPYLDFCDAWPNPLARCESPPPGFKIEHWDPRKNEETAKFVMRDNQLTEKGTAIV